MTTIILYMIKNLLNKQNNEKTNVIIIDMNKIIR